MLYLASAATAGTVSGARLRDLRSHKGIIAPLQAAAEGHVDFDVAASSAFIMLRAWNPAFLQHNTVGGRPEMQAAAQRAMMRSLRQELALLHLNALEPARRQCAARRASKARFLQVTLSSQRRSCISKPFSTWEVDNERTLAGGCVIHYVRGQVIMFTELAAIKDTWALSASLLKTWTMLCQSAGLSCSSGYV